jgi:ketosteroid isomerase-like protein
MRCRRSPAGFHLALAAAMAPVLLGGCAARTAPESTADDVRAIGLVLDDFHQAAAAGDFERYFGHFAPDAVFLGTDATERWTVEEFREYARPRFASGGGWTYRPRDRTITLIPGARTAFFDELLDNDGLGETRGSGVLVFEAERWKVAQYNLSIPIPNELAREIVGVIRRPR